MRVVNGVLWLLILVGLGAIAWWFVKGPFISPPQEETSIGSSVVATVPMTFTLGTYEGAHVRWNPCDGPISVRINYGSLDAESRTTAKRAVAQALKAARSASGLTLEYKGAITDPFPTVDSDTRRTDDNSIVIAFLPNDQALLRRTGQPLGIKRVMLAIRNASPQASAPSSASSSDPIPTATSSWRAIAGGDIQVGVPKSGKLTSDVLELLLTGFAATMGLDQSAEASAANVMAAQPAEGLTVFGPGDLAGLAAVGASQGCLDVAN